MDIRTKIKEKLIDYLKNNNLESSVFANLPKEAQSLLFEDDYLFNLFLSTFLNEDKEIIVSVIGEDLFFSEDYLKLKFQLLSFDDINS
ncbi:MAG: hypothetical protein IJC07_02845 [Clostridia bacterium]|nr:hypothetical protein [Clostridia bacterium]